MNSALFGLQKSTLTLIIIFRVYEMLYSVAKSSFVLIAISQVQASDVSISSVNAHTTIYAQKKATAN